VERKFSRYRDDNIVHRINTARGAPVAVDDETAALLDYAATCWRLSGGLFDITSGILATGLASSREVTLLVDVGTNGEMVLNNRGRLLATSTARGASRRGMSRPDRARTADRRKQTSRRRAPSGSGSDLKPLGSSENLTQRAMRPI
jgi:hypothetical protein